MPNDTTTIRDAGKIIRELRAENARLRAELEALRKAPGLGSLIARAALVRR